MIIIQKLKKWIFDTYNDLSYYFLFILQNDEPRLVCCTHPQLEYMQRYNSEYTWESFYQDDADFMGENNKIL